MNKTIRTVIGIEVCGFTEADEAQVKELVVSLAARYSDRISDNFMDFRRLFPGLVVRMSINGVEQPVIRD